jgi:hypothetical protein
MHILGFGWDGLHYQSISSADGVAWTVDTAAKLDGFDTASGKQLVRRRRDSTAGAPVTNDTSAGIAIAEHQLFVTAGGLGYSSAPGHVIAYRAG